MHFLGIDHLVLTVESIEKTLWFYCEVLGMEKISFERERIAIRCGQQKINLHEVGKEFEHKASKPLPGSADICLITDTPLKMAIDQLKFHAIEIIEGPVKKTGSQKTLLSIYVRDPDKNLLEISNYLPSC